MQITIDLPDGLAQRSNPAREAIEAVAIEGYRTEALSHHQAAQLLGLTRMQFDGFLKERKIYDHAYGLEDLEQDRATFETLHAQGIFAR